MTPKLKKLKKWLADKITENLVITVIISSWVIYGIYSHFTSPQYRYKNFIENNENVILIAPSDQGGDK